DENGQQLLFDIAATIPTLIDDHRLLIAVLANLLLEFPQARLIHRANVNVSDAAVREFINSLSPLFHPAVVTQRRKAMRVDGSDPRLPGAVFRRLVGDSYFGFVIHRIVE